MPSIRARTLAIAVAFIVPRTALAGGFELPDVGTQALGRGGAFVAKADDPTAIHHNPAGLAQQRGTSLLVNGNVTLHAFEYQRTGSFPDDPADPATPWGGKRFPAVANEGGPALLPFVAATTDFGAFDRLTVAVGLFTPSVVGNRTFPVVVARAPAPSRYDYVQSRSAIVYPTAALGFRLAPWLDVGASAHLVLASFRELTIGYADLGQCKNREYAPCDARTALDARATSLAGTFGIIARPSDSFALGLTLRTPTPIEARGTATTTLAKGSSLDLAPGRAFVSTELPWSARAGARYIAKDGDLERFDVELDASYEAWGAAQGEGPHVRVPELGPFRDVQLDVTHRYHDTFGVRGGAAYAVGSRHAGVLTLRAGAYYDSSATSAPDTRLDFDTLAKVAGTAGVGLEDGAFAFDVAYAAVASLPRVVRRGEGDVRPANGAMGGRSVDANGRTLPAVNEGAYSGFTHILSAGITIRFDVLFGGAR